MSMKEIKLRLTMDVTYAVPDGVTEGDLRDVLRGNASAAVGNGLLTGPLHEVEVDEHSLNVEIVKASE